MKLLVTGGTGLIGRRFIERYTHHDYTVLTRDFRSAQKKLPQHVSLIDSLENFTNLDGFDGVINLAGEPIIDRRWTAQQKLRICESRWAITQALVDLINKGDNPPNVFLSGSAVGIYGDQGDTKLDEAFGLGRSDFASELCFHWEQLAQMANKRTRCATLRTGIVLDGSGGALSKMILPFKLCLGGPLGNGKQYMPWIHNVDVTRALEYLLVNQTTRGAVNLVAPGAVRNKEFSIALARTLKRIAVLPVPAFILKTILGESSILLLGSQNVVPKKLLESGFQFQYPQLNQALDEIL